jgi:hypothetical protein
MLRFAKISVLTDATIHNFRNGRIKVEYVYDEMPLLKALLGIKDFNAFEKQLYETELIFDERIPSMDIEEIGWGHWVDVEFVNSVEEIVQEIHYDQESSQIVILLLLYKYFDKYFGISVKEFNDNAGALELIDFINNMSRVKDLSANLKINLNSLSNTFDSEAVALLHVVFKEYFNTPQGKKYQFYLTTLTSQDNALIKFIRELHGRDKGRSREKFKSRLVNILFIHFRKYCKEKRKRLSMIGLLIDFTLTGESWKKLKGFEDVDGKYSDNLRHIVRGIK